MDIAKFAPAAGFSALDRFYIYVAGADRDTLRLCPEHDLDNIRAIARLMIATWVYQTVLFSLMAHILFAPDSDFHMVGTAGSMSLATFILLIDSYMVMRSGFHLSGIAELRRGGINIAGGATVRIKAAFFLLVRVILSIGIAQLTAVFLSILIFHADISARTAADYRDANSSLMRSTTSLVGAQIQRATDAVNSQNSHVTSLATQVGELRQGVIDPSLNDRPFQQAQREVDQLVEQRTQAEEALQKAETFSSDELGGVRGAPNNSGIPGAGPRRKAAVETVGNARDRIRDIDASLQTARDRLENLRRHSASSDSANRELSRARLPEFDEALAHAKAELTDSREQLFRMLEKRSETISQTLEATPGYVPLNNGLLAQISALDEIAGSNRKVLAVIILIDLTSFGFELAAVLAKITSFVPTSYAALLARNAYMQVVRIVDGMIAELNQGVASSEPFIDIPLPGAPSPGRGPVSGAKSSRPSFGGMLGLSSTPKRRRGRPRKRPGQADGGGKPSADE